MLDDDKQKELKLKMEQIWGKTKAVLKRGHQEVLKVSQVGKLKMDHSSLARQRDRLLTALGELVVLRHSAGKLDSQELAPHVDRIVQLNREIQHLDELIEKARATRS